MVKIIFDKDNNQAIAYDNNLKIGECVFLESEDSWNIIHTEVNNNYQGQGIAKKLVECVIEAAKEKTKKVIAECSYAKRILEKQK